MILHRYNLNVWPANVKTIRGAEGTNEEADLDRSFRDTIVILNSNFYVPILTCFRTTLDLSLFTYHKTKKKQSTRCAVHYRLYIVFGIFFWCFWEHIQLKKEYPSLFQVYSANINSWRYIFWFFLAPYLRALDLSSKMSTGEGNPPRPNIPEAESNNPPPRAHSPTRSRSRAGQSRSRGRIQAARQESGFVVSRDAKIPDYDPLKVCILCPSCLSW